MNEMYKNKLLKELIETRGMIKSAMAMRGVKDSERKYLDNRLQRVERDIEYIKSGVSIPVRGGTKKRVYGSGVGYTLAEVGDKFGITRERVRQIESSGLKKLKNPLVGRALRPYLIDLDDINKSQQE